MRVALLARHPAAAPAPPTSRGLVVRPVWADRDAPDVVRLAADVAAFSGGPGPRVGACPSPRGGGMLAELASRPSRQVESWLAVIQTSEAAGEHVAGLVSLVGSRSATGIRHSIGWLLVHPRARRRGVGGALVAHACHRAAELAAETVWVESRTDWAEAMAFWHAVGFERVTPPVNIGGSAAKQRKRPSSGSEERCR